MRVAEGFYDRETRIGAAHWWHPATLAELLCPWQFLSQSHPAAKFKLDHYQQVKITSERTAEYEAFLAKLRAPDVALDARKLEAEVEELALAILRQMHVEEDSTDLDRFGLDLAELCVKLIAQRANARAVLDLPRLSE